MRQQALITGASRGLGYELARVFYANHFTIFPLVRDKEVASRLEEGFKPECHPILADLRNDDCQEEIRSVLTQHTDRLDVLINNAGVPGTEYEIETASSQEVLELLNVHCLGAMRTVRAALDFLHHSFRPLIVNVSSRLGSLKRISSGEFKKRSLSYSYRISKAAQNMFTVCLSEELKDAGITAIALHPGELKTSMGSPDAQTDASQAAKNIFSLLDSLDRNDTGKFYGVDGSLLPW